MGTATPAAMGSEGPRSVAWSRFLATGARFLSKIRPRGVLVAAVVAPVLVAAAAAIYYASDRAQSSLELLKVALSWPPVVLAIVVYAFHRYHEQIKGLLERATEVGPQGIKAERQPPPPLPPPAPEPPVPLVGGGEGAEAPVPTPESIDKGAADQAALSERAVVEKASPEPPEGQPGEKGEVRLSREMIRDLAKQYALQVREAEGWKFQFLSQFLVYSSKNVLNWFAGLGAPATLVDYGQVWRYSIPDQNQRLTIVDVLRTYGLLDFEPLGLRITDEGRRALEYFRTNELVPFSQPLVVAPVGGGAAERSSISALLNALHASMDKESEKAPDAPTRADDAEA